jgi:hypothetical protein
MVSSRLASVPMWRASCGSASCTPWGAEPPPLQVPEFSSPAAGSVWRFEGAPRREAPHRDPPDRAVGAPAATLPAGEARLAVARRMSAALSRGRTGEGATILVNPGSPERAKLRGDEGFARRFLSKEPRLLSSWPVLIRIPACPAFCLCNRNRHETPERTARRARSTDR